MRGPHVANKKRSGIHRDPSHLRPPVGQRLTGDRIPLYPTISRHIPVYPGSFFLFAGRVSGAVKPWTPGEQRLPKNIQTDTPYRGGNSVYLSVTQTAKGYSDHRWATYKQIKDMGGQVRTGEKATHVLFYKFDDEKKKAQEQPGTPTTEGQAEKEQMVVDEGACGEQKSWDAGLGGTKRDGCGTYPRCLLGFLWRRRPTGGSRPSHLRGRVAPL